MKKYSKLLLALAIILSTGFIFWKVEISKPPVKKQVVQSATTSIIVNGKSFDISNFVGKTALEATQANTKVVTNGTGINAFITSINEKPADPKKHEFWEFDVNGTEAQVGAGSYIIKKGDLIEWKLSTY